MDKSIICECNNSTFWYFSSYVRCVNCYNEFKYDNITNELWLRRFNLEINQYNKNWEKYNHA